MLEKILLAEPRGFCAGVDRAIKAVEDNLNKYKQIYVRHPIVHNEKVVNRLEQKGAVFVEDLKDVTEKIKVIFSAHGTAPSVIQEADKYGLSYVNAVCPLVTKVHNEALKYHKNGYSIILIGHKNHQEVNGTMGYAPMTLVETVEDARKVEVDNSEKVALITQTTLSIDDTAEIINALKERFPNIKSPKKEDICYATTNRQEAVKLIANESDLILVVGSETSSNTNRLLETALNQGVDAYLIQDETYIKDDWLDKVKNLGLTSGASVPEDLFQGVVAYIGNKFPSAKVETMKYTEEHVNFVPVEEFS